MARKHTPRRERRPIRFKESAKGAEGDTSPQLGDRFIWTDDDVTWNFQSDNPVAAATQTPVISEELHTILWSLEHVPNKQGLADAMINVASYLSEHPQDQALVGEGVRRAEQRVEHST